MTFIFIHGTGVRRPAYDVILTSIRQQLQKHAQGVSLRLEECYWGDDCGSALRLNGASIPNFAATKALTRLGDNAGTLADGEWDDARYIRSLWGMLYDNPLIELEILAMRGESKGDVAPGQKTPGQTLDARVRALSLPSTQLPSESKARLEELLASNGLNTHLLPARDDVVETEDYKAALRTARAPLTDYRVAVARAILARSAQRFDATIGASGFCPLDGGSRDEVVELLIAEFGGREAGVVDWVKSKASGLIKGWVTNKIAQNRGQYSLGITPGLADIVLYQTRPEPFRAYIKNAIQKAAQANTPEKPGNVVLIAHSLGGIIAVDLLISEDIPEVSHLITVGSQAPLLYEVGTLSSLPFDPQQGSNGPHSLPASMNIPWLNIYDPNDFLSYLASPVFSGRIFDYPVDNGQPFPASHSAYWANDMVWERILAFTREFN